jgi:hypothetical protein
MSNFLDVVKQVQSMQMIIYRKIDFDEECVIHRAKFQVNTNVSCFLCAIIQDYCLARVRKNRARSSEKNIHKL